MYGYRGRIGLIVPSSNTTNEPEFYRWVPDGVSVHSARMQLADVTESALIDMADDVEDAVVRLETAGVDVIAFGCTTGSLVEGAGHDERIRTLIEDVADVPGVVTSSAIKDAFDAVGATSLAIATPYTSHLNRKEVAFLEDNGYEVTGITGLELEPNLEIGSQSPSTAYRLAREIDDPAADAVFISCTNFRTFEIVDRLERDLEKPVITSNAATLWAALDRLGVDASAIELGELFTHPVPK